MEEYVKLKGAPINIFVKDSALDIIINESVQETLLLLTK